MATPRLSQPWASLLASAASNSGQLAGIATGYPLQSPAFLQVDQQQGYRRRGHSRNATGPGQGIGPGLSQLLFHLVGQAVDLLVIQVRGQRGIFIAPQALYLFLLAVDVTGVLGLYGQLFGRLGVLSRFALEAGDILVDAIAVFESISRDFISLFRVLSVSCDRRLERDIGALTEPPDDFVDVTGLETDCDVTD